MNLYGEISRLHVVAEGDTFIVLRGWLSETSTSVIVKEPRAAGCSVVARLYYEHLLLERLSIRGVPKTLGFSKIGDNFRLLLEDMGKPLLTDVIQGGLSTKVFLELALQLVDILGELHRQGVIHKNINPDNIVLDGKNAALVDFSIATDLHREKPELVHPLSMEGALPYISPEQTGRMNREIDYRSDYYSLGATFYTMLTGKMPFNGNDALEWVHCHIAVKPIPPHVLQPSIPVTISQIVLKLLSKNAEERYQSTDGLHRDLQCCLDQLNQYGRVKLFTLAETDLGSQLQAVNKLYGRTAETKILVEHFDDVCRTGQSALLLVHGFSGIGKTSVVNEIHKPVVARRGLFISGKFDQLRGNTPYASILFALRSLIDQILSESETELQRWRTQLREALGVNARVVCDVLPQLSLVLGETSVVPELGPTENQNRFNLCLLAFIQVIAQQEHPLVIFLDDLQWADTASLQLIARIVSHDECRWIMVIGAYRDNEVGEQHPLSTEILKQSKLKKTTIEIPSLSIGDCQELLSTMLSTQFAEAKSLAALVYQKTAGNPFFMLQLIQNLYEGEYLRFSCSDNHWLWDIEEIKSLKISDDVGNLMANKLQRLPYAALELMKQCACLGNYFSLNTLAETTSITFESLAETLAIILQRGLLVPICDAHRVSRVADHFPQEDAHFKFMHDRVQHAAYQLIPPEQRPKLHLNIARKMVQGHSCCEDEQLFFTADQYIGGLSEIVLKAECLSVAEHLYKAGRRALESAAFIVAYSYFKRALSILPEDSWRDHYAFCLQLHSCAADAAYYAHDDTGAQTLAASILENTHSILDQFTVYDLQVRIAVSQNNMQLAIKKGLHTLHILGEELSRDISAEQLIVAYRLLQERIDNMGGVAAIRALPVMTDSKAQAIVTTLAAQLEPSYTTDPLLFQLLVLRIADCCLGGYHPLSGFAFACYGLLLCSARQKFEQGSRIGELALELTELHHERRFRARVLHVVNGHVRHYWMPFAQTLPGLQAAMDQGFAVGDFNFAGHACMYSSTTQLFVGTALSEVDDHFKRYLPKLKTLDLDFDYQFLLPWHQLVVSLHLPTPETAGLNGDYFNEERLTNWASAENKMHPFAGYSAKAMLSYFFKDYEHSAEYFAKANEYSEVMVALIHHHQHLFYFALSELAAARLKPDLKYAKQAEQCLVRLKVLCRYAPHNFINKCYLIEGEVARNRGDIESAIRLYDKAIEAAENSGFIHEVALANELAADCYIGHGLGKAAEGYLNAALQSYRDWGALAKVAALYREFPEVLRAPLLSQVELASVSYETTEHARTIDLLSAIKLSQVIAREFNLKKLPHLLLQIVSANAGAESGSLLLMQNGELHEAASYPGTENDRDTESPGTKNAVQNVCGAAIRYVTRKQEPLVVHDARLDTICQYDERVKFRDVRSLLCFPIREHSRLVGILYLENSQACGVFNGQLLEFIQLIAAQAAISIENGFLLEQLQMSQKTLLDQTEILQSILNSIGEGVIVADANQNFLHFNRAAKDIHGIGAREIPSEEWAEAYGIYDSRDKTKPLATGKLPLVRALRGESFDDFEVYIKNLKTSQGVTVATSGRPFKRSNNETDGGVVVYRDITDRKLREEHIKHLATHDALTKLPNRMLFMDRIEQALMQAEQEHTQGALLFLDLDNFKEINDALGHDMGDGLLVSIAQCLQKYLKNTDTVARLGGDEFGMILRNLDGFSDAAQITQRIINNIANPVNVQGHVLNTGVSVGITMFPGDGEAPHQLLKNADLAMYSAKNMGRNTYCFYSETMNATLQFRKYMGEQLRLALLDQELVVHYQPQINPLTNEMAGMEALIRWPRHEKQFSPGVFIPIAEQIGLIVPIGKWVMNAVCDQINRWNDNFNHVPIAINVSALQLRQANFIDGIKALLEEKNMNPELLEFELTESATMYDVDSSIKKMRQLRDLGIRLSIDDFGTGYSSLSYLKRFPVQKVKIDQSFIKDLHRDKDSATIANAIIHLGHCLDMKVVAEGVETIKQLRFLCDSGCDIIQGFYYSQALDSASIEKWVTQKSWCSLGTEVFLH